MYWPDLSPLSDMLSRTSGDTYGEIVLRWLPWGLLAAAAAVVCAYAWASYAARLDAVGLL